MSDEGRGTCKVANRRRRSGCEDLCVGGRATGSSGDYRSTGSAIDG